ncbi:MAG: hypothetical protein F4Z31_22040 [Gemmatimonadetes bacterium]|nr:hypothetical protein [Gemmatimonadota bacterium]MYA44418.1 hypothetical protein [Gemmatimonadota bacterium]MYE94626.1 hypothetical protein [Gemmatimonadota bacterium]MYJ11496.1 hypothetical protein [Gemmatimonadota bacterium]
MNDRRHVLAMPILLGLLVVFADGTAGQNPGPDLILRDSVVLEETVDHYIGNPLALFVAADGSLLVSDGFAETVLRYDATGRLTGHLGGRGSGPGEFLHLGSVGFVTESVAGFLDETGRLELFDPMTGAHHGRVRVDVNNRPSSFAVSGDSLWFVGNNRVSSASHGVIAIADLMDAVGLLEQAPPIVLDRGTVPAPYRERHALAGSLSIGFLDVGDRDLVLGFTGSPFVIRIAHEGAVTDTVWIGKGLRRGEPDEAEFLEVMRGKQPDSQQDLRSWIFDFFTSSSLVRELSRDGAGNVYTLHQESDRDEDGTMTSAKLYAAVSRFDGDRGCGDTLIPTSDVGVPMPFLQGSTLWVLDRRLRADGATSITTVVRRFTIDADRCTGTVR